MWKMLLESKIGEVMAFIPTAQGRFFFFTVGKIYYDIYLSTAGRCWAQGGGSDMGF